MSSPDNLQRTVLPIPDQPRTGSICYDAKDPENKYPPLRPPAGAPNVLLVLIDDAGFGSSSAFGGLCNTPTAELLAAGRNTTPLAWAELPKLPAGLPPTIQFCPIPARRLPGTPLLPPAFP